MKKPEKIESFVPVNAYLEIKEIQEKIKNHRHVYRLKSQAHIYTDKKSFSVPVTHYLNSLEYYDSQTLYSGKLLELKQNYFFIHNKKELSRGHKPHSVIKNFKHKKQIIESISAHTKEALLPHLYSHLLVGQSPVDTFISDLFSLFGLTHILVISGFHFSLMLLVSYFFLKPLISRRLLHPALILIAITFFLFIGKTPSMLRALICLCFVLIANIKKQQIKPLNGLSLAATISLVQNPNILFNIGFKLTFLATFAILIAYKPIKKLVQKFLKPRSLVEFQELSFLHKHLYIIEQILVKALSLNFAVFIMTTPTLLYHIQTTPLSGLFYNLFIPFLITLILPPLMLCMILPKACPYLLPLIEPIAKEMLDILYFAPTKFFISISTELINAPLAALLTIIFAGIFLLDYTKK